MKKEFEFEIDYYCLCGHAKESHALKGRHFYKCKGTTEENCTCHMYKKKERS